MTDHEASFNPIGVNRLGWEHQIFPLAKFLIYVVCIAVSWNNSTVYRLAQANHLPCSRSTLSMPCETLLGHHRNSVALCTTDICEDIVIDMCFIRFLLVCSVLRIGRLELKKTYISHGASTVN